MIWLATVDQPDKEREGLFHLLSLLSHLQPEPPPSSVLSWTPTRASVMKPSSLPCLSLPCHHPLSLSLSLSKTCLPLSSNPNARPLMIHELRPSIDNWWPTRNLKRHCLVERQLSGGQLTVVAYRAMHVATSWLPSVVPPSPIMPTAISRSPKVHFGPTIVMVPSVCDKSGRIVQHIFWSKLSKLWL